MEYINNGITFNNAKINQGLGLSCGPVCIAGLVGTDPDDGTGVINAIDIDWNGAELESLIKNDYIKRNLSNLTINTTSDLLNLIVELANLINNNNTADKLFSYGSTPITQNNYTVVNNVKYVDTYPSEVIYEPTFREYLFILVKSNVDVEIIDATTNAVAYVNENSTLIPGYKIISTNGKVGAKVFIRLYENNEGEEPQHNIDYYFSYGVEEINNDNYTYVNGPRNVDETEYDGEYEFISNSRNYVYVLVKEDKNVEILESTFNTSLYTSELENINIKGHKVIKTNSKVYGKIKIIIS